MRRKYFFFSFAAALMLVVSSLAVSAQVGQLSGTVVIQQADGTTVPAVGGVVDVYRTDISGKYQAKLDKNGKFIFAGLPFVGTYIIAASAPNARPDVLRDVKAGRDIDYKITLSPGNGNRLTEAEAKSISAQGPSGNGGDAPKESSEDRKKRDEMIAKNKEIAAANEKNKNINEIVGRTFKAGNDALQAHKYDEAIAQYDEGLAADADQPALLTNKSVALRSRGVDRYNASVKSTDEAAKNSGLEAAKQDFKAAAEAATKAVELLKAQTPPTDPAALKGFEANKYFALATRAEAMRLLVSKADPSQIDAGLAAYQEYIAAETAPDKKVKAQVAAAQMLLDTGQGAKAAEEFRKILAANPDNVDAELGLGLSLFSTGEKANFQEAANHLQRFIDKAPDTHPLKQSAKESLDYLKSQENVKPEKTSTPARRRG
jgi:tetratricopeptide (TPR) repeat protein